MREAELRELVRERLAARMQHLGLKPSDLSDDLDLVRSGLLDSLGFVDLMAELEQAAGRAVDLEQALSRPGATQLKQVIALFR